MLRRETRPRARPPDPKCPSCGLAIRLRPARPHRRLRRARSGASRRKRGAAPEEDPAVRTARESVARAERALATARAELARAEAAGRGEPVPDPLIFREVQQLLLEDPALGHVAIAAEVDGGVVTLRGAVPRRGHGRGRHRAHRGDRRSPGRAVRAPSGSIAAPVAPGQSTPSARPSLRRSLPPASTPSSRRWIAWPPPNTSAISAPGATTSWPRARR